MLTQPKCIIGCVIFVNVGLPKKNINFLTGNFGCQNFSASLFNTSLFKTLSYNDLSKVALCLLHSLKPSTHCQYHKCKWTLIGMVNVDRILSYLESLMQLFLFSHMLTEEGAAQTEILEYFWVLSSEDQFRSQLLSFAASNRAFLNLDVRYGRNETALSVLSIRQRGDEGISISIISIV